MAIRASIILLADAGRHHREIARELKISRDMARFWRNRWLALAAKEVVVVARLQDAARTGAPATFSLEQVVHLFTLACENPFNRLIKERRSRPKKSSRTYALDY
ncbi:MAG: helix-turn-helix domain-containing protein [Leptolyngbya sp. BL-A-14]